MLCSDLQIIISYSTRNLLFPNNDFYTHITLKYLTQILNANRRT